jgi:hypothetical protein
MILGLPWASWLLLIVGVGLGFGISLRFYLAHRRELRADPASEGGNSGAGQADGGADQVSGGG